MVPVRKRKLLSPERELLICRSLTDGVKTISELSGELGVSEATVRRDLEQLEAKGVLRRVHGGAELLSLRKEEPVYEEKASLNALEKSRIAELAAKFINDSDTIFLDGGSTVLELAKNLPRKKDLTVVTNSLMAAFELMEKECRLVLVGGEFRKLSRTLVGPLTGKILEGLRFSKAFLGTLGFDPEEGLSTTSINEAYTKELVMRQSERVIVLADSSKIGCSSFVRNGALEDIDILVTDGKIPPGALNILKDHNIEVVF